MRAATSSRLIPLTASSCSSGSLRLFAMKAAGGFPLPMPADRPWYSAAIRYFPSMAAPDSSLTRSPQATAELDHPAGFGRLQRAKAYHVEHALGAPVALPPGRITAE